MITCEKIIWSGDAAAEACSAMESASWIWHPEVARSQPTVLRFLRDFTATREPVIFHVSADQRFLLRVDGVALVRGPDGADLMHWPFATYTLSLSPGAHRIEAEVWWIGAHAPMARISSAGGFILKAEGDYNEQLTTGVAAWQVQRGREYSFTPWVIEFYQAVGDQICIDGRLCGQEDFIPAEVIETADQRPEHGLLFDKWNLVPTPLPDQVSSIVGCGRVCAVEDRRITSTECIPKGALFHDAIPSIQALIDGTAAWEVPGNTTLSFLCDLEDYYCAFPRIKFSGGQHARVFWSWAEALYEQAPP